MARTRSLLLNAEVRPAGRACNCKHNARHRISRGEPRLIVSNPGPASGEAGYCRDCATAMLTAARDQLDQLATALERPGD
jgi:hypothetical protein